MPDTIKAKIHAPAEHHPAEYIERSRIIEESKVRDQSYYSDFHGSVAPETAKASTAGKFNFNKSSKRKGKQDLSKVKDLMNSCVRGPTEKRRRAMRDEEDLDSINIRGPNDSRRPVMKDEDELGSLDQLR